jgi:hypothetical protein
MFLFLKSQNPWCSCKKIGKVQLQTEVQVFVPGQSYKTENSVSFLRESTRANVYIYKAKEKEQRNKALDLQRKNCYLPKIIGELYPKNFEYSEYINGYSPLRFIDEERNIYEILFSPKDNRCFIQ